MYTLTHGNITYRSKRFEDVAHESFVLKCHLKNFKIKYPNGYVAHFEPPKIDQEKVNKLEVTNVVLVNNK